MPCPGIPRACAGALPSQALRPFRLFWCRAQTDLDDLLLLQRLDISETLCGGIEGRLDCLSTTIGIPLERLLGQPVTIQLVTDDGTLHPLCAIVTEACEGESDGSLAAYQLVVRDALSVMERRINSRIFRTLSVVDIIRTLVYEWRRRSPTLGGTFNLDVSTLDLPKYPVREQIFQFEESDAAFIRRLCRREGIAWFVRAGGAPRNADPAHQPFHTLVLLDNAVHLTEGPAGTLPWHADAAVGPRDAITRLSRGRRLVAGSVRRASWDMKAARAGRVSGPTRVDQGPAGNDLARLLCDARIDRPHMGASWQDYERLGRARLAAHDARASWIDGAGGVRNLVVGCWNALPGHPALDQRPAPQRRFVVTALHHRGENNLPRDLHVRAAALFAASRWTFEAPPVAADTTARPVSPDGSSPGRYGNTFSAVPYGTPLTPAWDPRIDLPRVYPLTGKVVAGEGEEVYCDGHGRINVQIQGLDPADHEHANGAGTGGTPADSAALRVLSGWAGDGFGEQRVPRAGMEVLLDFMNGDPDRMYVAGVLHNGGHMPPSFSRTGALPGNRYLSGLRSREIHGQRYNQLRLDDTPSQISAQLASEHGHSQLNLGYLTHARENGVGADRGEGAELRTDAAAALRAAQGLLFTTWARTRAEGGQLDREELGGLLEACTELFRALGGYAGEHGGAAPDTRGQEAVAARLRNWRADAAAGTDGEQALMAFGAQAGSVDVTPKTHVTYAGENLDQVAQQNVQVTSGQQIHLQAGSGLALFAQAGGISAIAHQGRLWLQSQTDDTQIDSARDIRLAAAGGRLSGMAADEVVFTTSGGAYLKLHGANIELGCPGGFTVKADSHVWQGPAGMDTDLPRFGHAPLGRIPQLVRATDGQALDGHEGEVRHTAGERAMDPTDGAGRLPRVRSDRFRALIVKFFGKKA